MAPYIHLLGILKFCDSKNSKLPITIQNFNMIYNQWAAADEYGTRMSIGVTHTHTHSECKFFRDIVRPKGI